MTSDVGGFAKQNVGDSEGVFFSIWGMGGLFVLCGTTRRSFCACVDGKLADWRGNFWILAKSAFSLYRNRNLYCIRCRIAIRCIAIDGVSQ